MATVPQGGEPAEGDLRKAGEGLHEPRGWMRVALSCIGDAVLTTDAGGGVTWMNPVAEALTGWTQPEAAGVPLGAVFRILDEEGRQPAENPAAHALRGGVAARMTSRSRFVARDGTERIIDHDATPIRNEADEVAGVILIFRDITEHGRDERAAREALGYAEEIVATLREPFLVLDRGLHVKTANAAFLRAFQVSSEETVGRFVYELGNGQWDIPALRRLLEVQVNEEVAVHDFEVEHEFPGIGHRSMLLNARRFPPEGENPTLILLAIEDKTERMRSDAAVKGSELRYRRLFQTARDGILILDADTGRIIDANPFMSGLLGFEHDEFLGKELWEIGLFRDVAASHSAYRELREKGYVRHDNLPLKTKDGREVEVEFVSNIYALEDQLVAQCNIRDISERSRLERQTQEQALALADQHRRKDEFLAMLSHELRNPLSPILNAVHLLRLRGDEGPIQKQAHNVIERQVGQLSRLVDDLLEVSRITSGKIRLREELLDVVGVIERAVESVRPLIDRRRHELSVSMPPRPIWLRGDPTRLEQVVVNLLNNAAKYTDEGGQIRLTTRQEGDEMVLSVRDTGVGIDLAKFADIFDLFTQADRSLDRSLGGLGIGLALVRRLVEMHGGTVVAHSAGVGQGSEFVVRLPVLHSPAEESASSPTKPPDPPAPGWRILMVDDNVDSAEMLATLLKMSGHDVRTAYTGASGLEVAAEYLPDVVLLDIGLPGIDGYEVARRLRHIPHLGGVKIVAMTGYGDEADLRLAREAGFDSHQVKPTDFAKLEELLTTLLTPPGLIGGPPP